MFKKITECFFSKFLTIQAAFAWMGSAIVTRLLCNRGAYIELAILILLVSAGGIIGNFILLKKGK